MERAGVCTLDCPDTCSLAVTVDDGRIVKVRGSDALPYTDSVICNKVARHSAEFVHGPGRLHWPLRRVGPRGSGQFERIGWDEALDDDPSARDGGDRPLRAAGGDAAQLCGPARHAVRGQHVAALLPSARRQPTLSPDRCAVPCAAKPGPAPMGRCPASGRRRRRKQNSTSCGAITPPSPICIWCARSGPRNEMAGGWW